MRTFTHSIIAEAKRLGLKRVRIEYRARSTLLQAELHGTSVAVRLPRSRCAGRQPKCPIAFLHRELRRSMTTKVILASHATLDMPTPARASNHANSTRSSLPSTCAARCSVSNVTLPCSGSSRRSS